ncbi:MAG TPA: NAD-dependent epimerase/dehydratase family protein [Acidimicrobiales bacterium]|nr:NAD-dependent epimerase/dehydratase family protein [Acidimicrobiales bacterium]
MRALVTGATGFVGRSLTAALEGAGHTVAAGTRRPDAYRGPGQPVALDVADAGSVAAALAGVDTAYYLVHSMESGDFARRDREAATTVARAAADAGVRVVYLGGMGDEAESARRSAHLASRHEVGRILRDGADTVELRAAMVVGAGSASFEILRQLVDRLPAMVCPRWVTTACQPIALDDVVAYLSAAPTLPAGAYDVGGAEVLTYERMLRRYAALTGRRRLILKVPVLSPRLSSRWIGLVTDQPPSVARPLADGLSVEVVVRDDRIRRLVPVEPMGFDEMVRRALAADGRPGRAVGG